MAKAKKPQQQNTANPETEQLEQTAGVQLSSEESNATEHMEPGVEQIDDDPFKKKHYEEWRVELVNGKVNKLNRMRPRVMITDQQAAVLNEGVEQGKLNVYATMYYPA